MMDSSSTNANTAAAAATTNGSVTTTTTNGNSPLPPLITTTEPYTFPVDKLRRRLTCPDKTPLVLVACGSFSPITVLHVQMFAMAERYVADHPACGFELVGSYLSPVSDAYKKPALAPAQHRLAMCRLAVSDGSSSASSSGGSQDGSATETTVTTDIMVDPWEALRCDAVTREPVYTSTVDVLRHVDAEINRDGGIIVDTAPSNADDDDDDDGSSTATATATAITTTKRRAQIVLLMGTDVAATMGDPKLWPPSDVEAILGHYGAFVIDRPTQTDRDAALAALRPYYDDNRLCVVDAFENDVSSTKIRAQLRNGERVLDLARPVYEYIKTHKLYP